MNQAASPLVNREELFITAKRGGFYRQTRQKKGVSSKKWIVSGRVTFLWGTAGVYQVDFLTS